LIDGAAVAVISAFDQESIRCAAFSPCGRFLAAISAAGHLRILRMARLIPSLAAATRVLGVDGRIPLPYTTGDLLFPQDDHSKFDEYDPQCYLRQPPKVHKQCHLKVPGCSVSFSAGGNFLVCGLGNGSAVVLSMSTQRRWAIPQAHEAGVDGALFLKSSFHSVITWSQRGGDIKLWRFQEKPKVITTFTVRAQSRRSHLVCVSIACEESLNYGCTSQSIIPRSTDNPHLFSTAMTGVSHAKI
jgi:WD40 repeat protein